MLDIATFYVHHFCNDIGYQLSTERSFKDRDHNTLVLLYNIYVHSFVTWRCLKVSSDNGSLLKLHIEQLNYTDEHLPDLDQCVNWAWDT